VEELGLEGCWEMKPFYAGDEIKTILKNVPHGPPFREVKRRRRRDKEGGDR